jgi:DnaJ-class molecular chaperone
LKPERRIAFAPICPTLLSRKQSADELTLETIMANEKGPNVKKKAKCKNCEGKGLVKKGDKVVKCQRCHGTGLR